jgi:hypothetical protein
MGERKVFGTDEHRQRVEASKEEIDGLCQEIEAARCHAVERRMRPDRRRAPRSADDRRRGPAPGR